MIVLTTYQEQSMSWIHLHIGSNAVGGGGKVSNASASPLTSTFAFVIFGQSSLK
jgi:hypothetical protein